MKSHRLTACLFASRLLCSFVAPSLAAITFDTAATVAHVFGLRTPAAWIAKPVLESFK
jgi:hypothetical protein